MKKIKDYLIRIMFVSTIMFVSLLVLLFLVNTMFLGFVTTPFRLFRK